MERGRRARVLIVDDEIEVASCIRRILRRECDIAIATSGDQALEMLADFAPDLVISDFRMPMMSGGELLAHVKERSPDTLRMLISGYADPREVEDALRTNTAHRFLHKPFSSSEVLAAVRGLLEARS